MSNIQQFYFVQVRMIIIFQFEFSAGGAALSLATLVPAPYRAGVARNCLAANAHAILVASGPSGSL